MLVYSQSYQDFLALLYAMAKDILKNETKIKCGSSRFLYKNYYYPLDFVLFEDQHKLGFFDYKMKRIGIHKNFRYLNNSTQLKNLLRHELAHYLDFIQHGIQKNPHDKTFRELCKKYHWGSDVFKATTNFSFLSETKNKSNLTNKIQKLLSLSASDNIHEANLALEKANKLLLDNNLIHLNENTHKKIYMLNVLEQKIITPKFIAINQILPLYFVKTVINSPKGSVYIEVLGSKTNVEISAYVANFLDYKLEELWQIEKSTLDHIYRYSKKSFMNGIAIGFTKKITQVRNESTLKNEIIHIDKFLDLMLSQVYPKLGSTKLKHSKVDSRSKSMGEKLGKNLNIKKSLKKYSSKLISHIIK